MESPAKARKIGAFLGEEYVVEASVGHIRDLPQRAADIPAEYKKIPWAKEGVNIEEDFAPLYVINPDKRAKVNELKALMKDADILIAAVGRPGFVKPDMVKAGAIVIDIGTNKIGGKTVGDVSPEVSAVASFMTPVPGGVGPMTVAMLLKNVVELYKQQNLEPGT